MNLNVSKKALFITCAIVLVLAIAGTLTWYYYSPANLEYEDLGMKPTNNVVDNIYEGTNNVKFASFIKHVGYDTFLQEEGPYTIFVPTDSAYANLPNDANFALLDPTDPGFLRQVILYHVVKGRYNFDTFKDGMTLTTVQGEKLMFTLDDGYWVINDYAYIEKADIISTNGVIHMTTNYLIPPSLLKEE